MSNRTRPIKDIKINDGLGEPWEFDDPRWDNTPTPRTEMPVLTRDEVDAAEAITDRRPGYITAGRV